MLLLSCNDFTHIFTAVQGAMFLTASLPVTVIAAPPVISIPRIELTQNWASRGSDRMSGTIGGLSSLSIFPRRIKYLVGPVNHGRLKVSREPVNEEVIWEVVRRVQTSDRPGENPREYGIIAIRATEVTASRGRGPGAIITWPICLPKWCSSPY